MSSDSEDLDEDELLQIALKEQAERDRNYQRPPSRPVVNLVQPPSSSKQQTKGAAPPQRPPPPVKPRRPTKDEEDSEVELLSISSEDDEPAVGRPTGRQGVQKGRKEDVGDHGWDGGEPASWKHVDETELARRVREMRETRSAPIVEEQKPIGRKGLNNMPSLPRGIEFVDPLGLGIINLKTMTLMGDSPESFANQKDNIDLDQNTREKLMFYSDKFDAKLFLSRIHHHTSAADLEAGALGLKTDLRGRTQQRKQLVKENFDCFVSCKTTIDDIQSKLQRIEEDPEGAGTTQLYNCIKDVSSIADKALAPLFERQVQAEKIRSVQGMLQRFRTLFNLPSALRGNINKGEYDLAVREYRKAKSIVLPSHAGMLKRVFEEVEKVMHEFKGMLYKSMEDPQIALSELENTVRLLLELEPESDPIWHYLNIQNRRIKGLLERCTVDHEHRIEALQSRMREKVNMDARWRQIHLDSNKSSIDLSILLGGSPTTSDAQLVDLAGEEVDSLRGRYIRHLTAVVIHHLPEFWRLALSVFHGKFAKSSQVEGNVKSSVAMKVDDKNGDLKYSGHSLDEVADMIHGSLLSYEAKVMSTFRELQDSSILHPYMRDAIKEISTACQAIEGKESAPPSAVKFLLALRVQLARIYISRLCSWMRTTVGGLSNDELWEPVSMLERNKSPYTISQLPRTFQTMVMSAMDQIDILIKSLQNEVKSDAMFRQVQEMQESIRISFLNCFIDLSGSLEIIATEISQNRSNKDIFKMPNGVLTDLQGKMNGVSQDSVVTDPHQKLLVALSNIGYCKDQISRELYNKYKHIWMPSRERENEDDDDINDLTLSFSALEEKVLSFYTYSKTNLIRDSAMGYLLDGGIQWAAAPSVKGVRDASVDLLHTLVSVHAEVFSGAKPLLEKILGVLVEGLFDTLLSIFHENTKDLKSLDANGFCQLMLELEYFETILHAYITPDARDGLRSLHELLLERATENMNESLETPMHGRRATRNEDAFEDRQQAATISPDDLIAFAQQYSADLLAGELERTRLNIACFMESSTLPLDSVPENAKAAYSTFKAPVDSPKKAQRATQQLDSPMAGRSRRKGF